MPKENIVSVIKETDKPKFYPLTNDIIFHAVMQKSKTALKSLVGALLGIDPRSIFNIEIMNPIDIEGIDYKVTIMDLKVLLEESEIINVELQMQIPSETLWWTNRTILYLCRGFDNIGPGEDYSLIKPATQISIVNDIFLEDDEPEFYAKYRLMNINTHKIYASNFSLNVLYLNRSNLATKDEISSGLVNWAKLFLAKSMEDVESIAGDNPVFKEVAKIMYTANANDKTRYLAEAQEKYALDLLTLNNIIARKDAQIAELERQLKEARASK